MELDEFDRRLLNLVQSDAGQTAEQLAGSVGLSASAVQRRLKRLREAGVILREAAIVDLKSAGSPTFFITSLQIERERPELIAQLRAWLMAQDCVQQIFYVTGQADFVLVVTAPNAETYEALMARLLSDNPNVNCFTTNMVLTVMKRSLAIPVPP
ncbi:MAG TPA: Lrp/AsnC family transcriptional regulator [Steroidobacteraceae bacterium]|nr:Lrp/AsnC family transcriptional regulator [Steroidobacteraceae bacterium]